MTVSRPSNRPARHCSLNVPPNAKTLRFVESGSLLALLHKWTLRTCFNAQEEIFLASMDEVEQVRDAHPRIGRHIGPPCVTGGKVSEIETLVTRKGGTMNFYDPQALLATKDQDWESILPPAQRSTRAYMNEQANKYFSGFAADPQDLPNFATPCHRWEGGVHTTARNGSCSPKGLVLTHTHRRFPVTDVEAGITAGFINFNQSLPDVHMFKF